MSTRLRLIIVDEEGKTLGEVQVAVSETTSAKTVPVLDAPDACAGDPDDVIHESQDPGPKRSQAV
jgi:hypothetical protein